jgi:hypothetical protein
MHNRWTFSLFSELSSVIYISATRCVLNKLNAGLHLIAQLDLFKSIYVSVRVLYSTKKNQDKRQDNVTLLGGSQFFATPHGILPKLVPTIV